MTGSDSADDSADNLKLVAFSLRFCILQAIKNWRRRRPGNEARHCPSCVTHRPQPHKISMSENVSENE